MFFLQRFLSRQHVVLPGRRTIGGCRSNRGAHRPADEIGTAWLGAMPRVAFTSSEDMMAAAAWMQVQSAVSCARSCVVSCDESWR